MAKIAVELERALARRAVNGYPGRTSARLLARGAGWAVEDVICTCGPRDRPYEESRSNVTIAIVLAGTFQYRSAARCGPGCELMTPGSLLLGNPNESFECGHQHGAGDRCLAFGLAPDFFERVAADAGARGSAAAFRALRLPPARALAGLVARACGGLLRHECGAREHTFWEELSLELGARSVQFARGLPAGGSAPPGALARVTRVVRLIETHLDSALTLETLAREARLSPYHFLRTFQRLTGLTPHQYIVRARLRAAAVRLAQTAPERVLDLALASGFDDVSNFNRAFRREFGVNPRRYHRAELLPRARSVPASTV